jgi:hypothetical protein
MNRDAPAHGEHVKVRTSPTKSPAWAPLDVSSGGLLVSDPVSCGRETQDSSADFLSREVPQTHSGSGGGAGGWAAAGARGFGVGGGCAYGAVRACACGFPPRNLGARWPRSSRDLTCVVFYISSQKCGWCDVMDFGRDEA